MTQLKVVSGLTAALHSREEVAAVSLALGAGSFGGPLSPDERAIAELVGPKKFDFLEELHDAILNGDDPLGDALCLTTPLQVRREYGVFYTPAPIVESMVEWALEKAPSRFVDPGCGSGRFAAQAVRRDPRIQIVAIDSDPVATLACRAVLRTIGARSATVLNADYTMLKLPPEKGRTAFVGNPPYVRHHRLTTEQKRRARDLAARYKILLSGLAGLQIHFFLSTLSLSKQGDIGAFITSAEWLDVSYGAALRSLLMDGLGLVEFQLFESEAWAFQNAMTTALITLFQVGHKEEAITASKYSSGDFQTQLETRQINRTLLQVAKRWTPILHCRDETPNAHRLASEYVRLGEIVRVSRGVATGSNSYFVMNADRARSMGLEAYTFPVLHEARQVFQAGGLLRAFDTNKVLLDPPVSINLDDPEHEHLKAYIMAGEVLGVNRGYLASHRKPWWKVNSKAPPIVATYMARQPPAFALNSDGLRILNVIHGLYPRLELSEAQLKGLVAYLNANRFSFRGLGRTYQGGLEKFEPSEMEAFIVPHPDKLSEFVNG